MESTVQIAPGPAEHIGAALRVRLDKMVISLSKERKVRCQACLPEEGEEPEPCDICDDKRWVPTDALLPEQASLVEQVLEIASSIEGQEAHRARLDQKYQELEEGVKWPGWIVPDLLEIGINWMLSLPRNVVA